MSLLVAKWSRIFEEKTETKSAPKRIFSAIIGNGNYTSTKEPECPRRVCNTKVWTCL